MKEAKSCPSSHTSVAGSRRSIESTDGNGTVIETEDRSQAEMKSDWDCLTRSKGTHLLQVQLLFSMKVRQKVKPPIR